MLKEWSSYVKNERGSQALQFLGLFPLVILSMLIIWQVGLISYSVVVAEAAARDGARAASAHDESWEEIATKFGIWFRGGSIRRTRNRRSNCQSESESAGCQFTFN